MKIAILGTRGIPNNYGGCEANAEMMSPIFIREGHEVTVYCSHEHSYQESEWNGVKLKHIYCPEKKFKIWGTLLYDYLCLRDALSSNYDVVLELGYVPVAIFYPLFRKRNALLFTNMDGLEWKRSKWNSLLRKFTKFTEYLGAKYSDALIADNLAIQEYHQQAYDKTSHLIEYGAELIDIPVLSHIHKFQVKPGEYFMLIARLEPENNIEMILKGFCDSGSDKPMLVIGSTTTKFSKALLDRYEKEPGIHFLGGIFDYKVLSSLRFYSACYFHGHSVGGTNPSLLEAMASNALIAIHDNPFNAAVVGDDALKFSSSEDIIHIINSDLTEYREYFTLANREKIVTQYTWENAVQKHLEAFSLLDKKHSK